MAEPIHETTLTIRQLLNSSRPNLFPNAKDRSALDKKYQGNKDQKLKVTFTEESD